MLLSCHSVNRLRRAEKAAMSTGRARRGSLTDERAGGRTGPLNYTRTNCRRDQRSDAAVCDSYSSFARRRLPRRLLLRDADLNELSVSHRLPVQHRGAIAPVLRGTEQLRVEDRMEPDAQIEADDAALLVDDDLEES